MGNRICVYAICRNELQFLEKWYLSMREADFIAVLDTGSTDGTWEALKELSERDEKIVISQKVYDPWRFDVPRNDCMDLVPRDCNILLSTDLDEYLEPGWSVPLREKWVDGKHERCTYRYIWSHLENGEPGRVFGYNKIHTWKWRWRYPVHELLWNTETQTETFSDEENLDLFDEITLHHYPDLSKPRSNYLPLLELRKKESSEDWYGLIYLAHEYYYQGHYEKALSELDFILTNYRDRYSSLEEASCHLFKGDSLVCLGREDEALESYGKAISVDDTYREPYVNMARIYLGRNDYDSARSILKRALDRTYRHYTWLERDISWSYEIYDLLSLACFYSGHKMESIAYSAIALSYKKDDDRLKENLRLCIENTEDRELI